MKHMTLSRKWVAGMGLLYLLLPCILFLLGWVQAPIAWPSVLLLIVGATLVWRKLPAGGRPISGNDLAWWAAGAFLCLFSTESLGLNSHTLQCFDIPTRSIIYEELIHKDWPLFSSVGDYFVYYHAFWLPPAVVAKLAPGTELAALYLWIFLGSFLAYTAFLSRWKGKRAFFSFVLVLMLGSLADAIFLYPTYLSKATANLFPDISFFFAKIAGFVPAGKEIYLANWSGVGECTFNCAVPGILLLCMCIGTRLRQCCWPFFFALLVPVSPLCAVGLLPWLAFSLCRNLATRKDSLAVTIVSALCALPLVICMTLYYMSGDGSSARFLWNDSSYYYSVDQGLAGRWVRYASILLALLVPAFIFLYRRYKRTMLFWSAVYLAVFTPVVWIGEEHNELIFKCSVIIHFSVALLYASLFIHTRHRVARLALAFYMLLGGGWILGGYLPARVSPLQLG